MRWRSTCSGAFPSILPATRLAEGKRQHLVICIGFSVVNGHIKISILLAALIGAASLGYLFRSQAMQYGGMLFNYARSWHAPAGTLTVEVARSGAVLPPPFAPALVAATDEWPSYNRTLTSERFSPLHQIEPGNVAALHVLCTYDTQQLSAFQAGPLVVSGALVGTTETDIFSIDAASCKERWRTRDHFRQNAVNRGAAYLDGLLYRGTGDGRVVAYDFNTGARVWDSTIADSSAGETVPAAPIAWNGMVFVGNAGGDRKGVKGRMYALDAKTGTILWEFYLVPRGPGDVARGPPAPSPLDASTWQNQPATPITGGASWTSYTLDPATGELYVPTGNSAPDFAPELRKGANLYSGSVVVLDAKTGAYKRHFELTSGDWHDWDVSNTPSLVQTRGGRRLMAIAPKDGLLYGFNIDSGSLIYRTPVNRIENAEVRFSTDTAVHFCPGGRGGAEWNGPAYDPQTNLIFVGSVEWCSTITIQTDAQIAAAKPGNYWAAMATHNPYHTFGVQDSFRHWAGWVYATDADTGVWKWRAKSNYPVQSGLTPTAGGVVFFGDLGGNFYALESATGRRLWGANLGGAIGGGVVSYTAGGAQKVAVLVGSTGILWPTKVVSGKVVILGLPRH
jgi:alcohol dehydrogenase (cytochrome c)